MAHRRTPCCLVLLFALLTATEAHGQEVRFGETIRITGATVLRGGPASPPRIFPHELEGTVVGMRSDTLLFETGIEPVYWIPLGEGSPQILQRGSEKAVLQSVAVGTAVGGVLGAITAWTLNQECRDDRRLIDLGLREPCANEPTAGEQTLKGFLIGGGIGAAVGFGLGQFSKRTGWFPVDVADLRFVSTPTHTGFALSIPW